MYVSMNKDNYSGMSISDLQKTLHDKKKELGKLKFTQKDRTQLKDTSSIRKVRKSIARILTKLNVSK
jgi:ribosomal protein L29